MDMESVLRDLCVALISVSRLGMPKERIEELIDIVRFSSDPEELVPFVEEILEQTKAAQEEDTLAMAESIIKDVAKITGKDPLEIKSPRNLQEALSTLCEMISEAKEQLECTRKEDIEKIKDYIKGLIEQIGKRYDNPDSKIIIEAALSRLESDPAAVFNPETYKRIQDLVIEREKELEVQRARLREKLKLVAKSLMDTISALDSSESSIISSLSGHVADIEDALQLDTIEAITEKLTQLSKNLRSTISKVKRELNRTRAEMKKSSQMVEQLKKELDKYKEMSIIDELTHVLNRRGLMEILEREIARSKRFKLPLSVVMVDIDDFKKVNDTYGHPVGDKVLQTVAQILKNSLRITDVVARYGGEEFLVVLPNTGLEDAKVVAEKLRRSVEKKTYKYKDDTFRITISLGVTQLRESDTLELLLKRADDALYISKKEGKNRVTVIE